MHTELRGGQALGIRLREALHWATEVDAVTWSTDDRWPGLLGLEDWLQDKHRRARLVLGRMPPYDHAVALLRLGEAHDGRLDVRGSGRRGNKLHMKLVHLRGPGEQLVFVGSANLTHSGLVGPAGGSVETTVETDDPLLIAQASQIFEHEWRIAKPLQPSPPQPPKVPTFLEYVLDCIRAGEFWIDDFSAGSTGATLPKEAFDLESSTTRSGSLAVVRSGRVTWSLMTDEQRKTVHRLHDRGRRVLADGGIQVHWGCFIGQHGRREWRSQVDALQAEFSALRHEVVARATDEKAVLQDLEDAARSLLRQENPKARLSSARRKLVLDAGRDALREFRSSDEKQPRMRFVLNPVAPARLLDAGPASPEFRSFDRNVRPLVLESLQRPRQLWLDGKDAKLVRRFQLLQDPRLDRYMGSLPGRQLALFGGEPPMERAKARRRAREELKTVERLRTSSWNAFINEAERLVEWKPPVPDHATSLPSSGLFDDEP